MKTIKTFLKNSITFMFKVIVFMIKMVFYSLCFVVAIVSIIIDCIKQNKENKIQQQALRQQEQEEIRKQQEEIRKHRLQLMEKQMEKQKRIENMVADITRWINKEFIDDLKFINKKQRELSQYETTQCKLTKNKELLQYIDERLKEVNGTRLYINELQGLTERYDNNIHIWLEQLNDIEFKLNDRKLACEKRIVKLEKRYDKEQLESCSLKRNAE